MSTLPNDPAPATCNAQYTDQRNTWACSGRHIGRDHVVYFDGGGRIQWSDVPADAYDLPPDLREFFAAAERVVAYLRGRSIRNFPRPFQELDAAYDQVKTGVTA